MKLVVLNRLVLMKTLIRKGGGLGISFRVWRWEGFPIGVNPLHYLDKIFYLYSYMPYFRNIGLFLGIRLLWLMYCIKKKPLFVGMTFLWF